MDARKLSSTRFDECEDLGALKNEAEPIAHDSVDRGLLIAAYEREIHVLRSFFREDLDARFGAVGDPVVIGLGSGAHAESPFGKIADDVGAGGV